MNGIKEEKNCPKLLDKDQWEKMIKDQLTYTSKNFIKHPAGTKERRQFIEVFTFWLKELLCIRNIRMDWVNEN